MQTGDRADTPSSSRKYPHAVALNGSQQLEAGNKMEPWVQFSEAQAILRAMDTGFTLPEAQHPNSGSGCGKWPLSLGKAVLEAFVAAA